MIKHQGWTELTDGGGAITLVARKLKNGVFVEKIAPEMRVKIAENGIVLNKWGQTVLNARHLEAGIHRVAEVAGVAEIVAGRHRRCICGREGWK